MVKNPPANAGDARDAGLIPGLGRSPGEGKGYPLQYSDLENSMGCIVHGVAKSRTQLDNFHFHFSLSKETRYSKLRNLAFFYVREDATIWAH